MKDIILVSIYNNACVEMALNFLTSLKKVGISDKHISYVTDQNTFDIITNNGFKAVLVQDFGLGEDKMNFATERFNLLCFKRYNIIYELLQKHEYVWHLDVDTVVLGDIIEYFNNRSIYHSFDMIFQNDLWATNLCCGCMLIKSSKNTLNLAKYLSAQNRSDVNDQVFLCHILSRNDILNIGLFPFINFINGEIYFKDAATFPEVREVFKNSNEPLYFVHANCMIGLETKIKALKEKGLWFLEQ
jgi:hypothetical protein